MPLEGSEVKLLPCPFCGEPPVLSTLTAIPRGFKVRCNFCWARSGDHKDAESAANAWNTRATPAQGWQSIDSARVYKWLGVWRDKIPSTAVTELQDLIEEQTK